MITKSLKQVWLKPKNFVAMGFGSGLSPIMPGTCGTLVGVIIYQIMVELNLWLYAFMLVLMFLFGIWLCNEAANEIGEHDHPSIVWDEIVGYLITMFAVPKGWLWVILGFIYFRVFDILKPWPIKMLDQKVKGGFGIMLDDLAAAIYAWILLQFSVWFLMPLFTN